MSYVYQHSHFIFHFPDSPQVTFIILTTHVFIIPLKNKSCEHLDPKQDNQDYVLGSQPVNLIIEESHIIFNRTVFMVFSWLIVLLEFQVESELTFATKPHEQCE
jgi:hypothetical protein